MEIVLLSPSGFCQGVQNAIDKVLLTRKNNPTTPIYVLGDLIHNTYVSNKFLEKNIITLDRYDDLNSLEKGIIITSAHGISKKVTENIKNLGFEHIDTTCPFVYKSFTSINYALNNNKKVLYFGKQNHPEAIAAKSIAPNNIIIFQSESDLINLDPSLNYVLTNQTTINHDKLINYYYNLLEKKYNVELLDEVCNVTKVRQETLKNALENKNFDLIIIVGDKKSNNTRELYEIAKTYNKNTLFVNSYTEIESEKLTNIQSVLIASGASAPKVIIKEIFDYLKSL